MKHYIRVTSGPYSGAIYALPTKRDAVVLERALQKLRPNSTDYGNDRDGFPQTHLKGRRALDLTVLEMLDEHSVNLTTPRTVRLARKKG